MLAYIEWIPWHLGGRMSPPSGIGSPPYSTIVRFADSSDPRPPHDGWSLVIEKVNSCATLYEWIADVRYLVEEAPQCNLIQGREFELYEGKKCVARGRIL